MSASLPNNYGFPLPYSQSAPKTVVSTVAPTTANWNYPLGQVWVNTTSKIAYILAGKASRSGTWVVVSDATAGLTSLTGDTGTATPTAGNIKIAGTTAQITSTASGSTITLTLPAVITAPGSLTTTTTLASGSTLTAGTSLSVTTSATVGTTITATLGNITATNGNFVSSTAGKGFVFNSPTTAGAASGPVIVNGRTGVATFTSVSIAAAADLTLTITNSAITGSSTQVAYSLQGATTGSALQIKSVTNSAGSSAVVVTNGTGATTSTADISLVFIVLN